MEIGFIIITAQIYRVPFLPGGPYWLYSLVVVFKLAEEELLLLLSSSEGAPGARGLCTHVGHMK